MTQLRRYCQLHGIHEVSDLEIGMDFRLPQYRREVFLRFYEFHLKYRAHAGAVYYVFPYLFEKLKMTDEQRIKQRIARKKRDAMKLNNEFEIQKKRLKCSALNGFRFGYNIGTQPHRLFGCSHQQLLKHVESQFESWMNWNNRGFGQAGQAKLLQLPFFVR